MIKINLNEFDEKRLEKMLGTAEFVYERDMLEYQNSAHKSTAAMPYDESKYYELLQYHLAEFRADYTDYKIYNRYKNMITPSQKRVFKRYETRVYNHITKVLFDLVVLYIEEDKEWFSNPLEEAGIQLEQFMFYFNNLYGDSQIKYCEYMLELIGAKKEGFDFEWYWSNINDKPVKSIYLPKPKEIFAAVNFRFHESPHEINEMISTAMDKLEAISIFLSSNRLYTQLVASVSLYDYIIAASTKIFCSTIANYVHNDGNVELHNIPEDNIIKVLEAMLNTYIFGQSKYKSHVKYLLDLKKHGYDNLQKVVVDDDLAIYDEEPHVVSSHWNK